VVLDPEPPAGGLRRPETLHRFETLDNESVAVDDAAIRCAVMWLSEAGATGIAGADLMRRGGLEPEHAATVLDALVASGQAVPAGGRMFATAVVAELDGRVLSELSAFHRAHPLESGMPREDLRERAAPKARREVVDAVLESLAARRVVGGTDRLALSTHRPTLSSDEERAGEIVDRLLREAGLTPPDIAGLAAAARVPAQTVERLIHLQVRARRLVRLDTLVFHADALAGFRAEIQALKTRAAPDAQVQIDVGDIKDRYGLSRKFAIPLLEWLDRERVTRRVGGRRVVL